ncbi:hypothetical protein FGG08_006295 [Glutinoglossum americanum]|uniref:Chromo domain-containing protein n=1 Tax=Glutinoglossum americanum TaxID=1670608 RepID=A0A9P8I5J7_9PEZI|nr:hypothetical protein FGG08_006295 [Glutinoglossum americanum]
MTKYSRLLHGNSSESETSAAAPATAMAPNGKPALNGSKKKRAQRLESLVPTARINYLQAPMFIERGDWVVRLREGDLATMNKLDETDIWDGPFPIIELPPANTDEIASVNITGDIASPVKDIPRVKLRFPSGSKGDPWTSVGRLIPVYPDPPRPEGAAPSDPGVIFHLRKGSATFAELQRFRPRGKKEKELYIVGRLRGRREGSSGSPTEYLVHWAGWPSEDDSWEGVDGIPESFREEYEKANPRKKTDAKSKNPKAKKERSPTKGKDSLSSAVARGETPGARRMTPTPLTVDVAGTFAAPTPTNSQIAAVWGATTPARRAERRITPEPPAQTQPKTRTPKPKVPPPHSKKPHTPVPLTPTASKVLGKRSRNARAEQQKTQVETPEVVTGKRRRVASAKRRASMA